MECQGFSWEFPIYALAAKETVTLENGVAALDDNIRFIAPEALTGKRGLALFTSTQTAETFREQSARRSDLLLFNIPDVESLHRLLSRAGDLYNDVLFDLNPAAPAGQILAFQGLLQLATQEVNRQKNRGGH